MPRGGRKYNIWIAYSDLFTNLSTFLFISALGVFALFGSGLRPQVGLGSSDGCTIPAKAEESLLNTPEGSIQPPSLLAGLDAPAAARPGCARYYKIGDARFVSPDPAIGNFKHALRTGGAETPLAPPDLLMRVCQPLWLLISRRDFRAHEGRVTFRGIPSVDQNGWRHAPQCQRGEEPKIRHWDVPADRSQMEIIQVCKARPGDYGFCAEIKNCLARKEGDRNSACQRVVAVVEWNRRAALACNEQAVRQQALTLYKVCESAPSLDSFQNQLYRDEDTFVEEARYDDTRAVLWEQVGFDAHVRSKGRQTPLDALPAGAVALDVQYSR